MTPALRLALGAVCISFSPVFIKLIALAPTWIAFYRLFFGGVALLAIYWCSSGVARFKQSLGSVLWLVCASGSFFFACDNFFWNKSVLLAGAGLATILANTQVFFLALYGRIFHREQLSWLKINALGLAVVGIALLIGFPEASTNRTLFLRGTLFGVLTGFFYAGYILSLRHAQIHTGKKAAVARTAGKESSETLNLAFTSIFAAFWLFFMALAEGVPAFPSEQISWFWIFCLALISQALGWTLIAGSLAHVPVSLTGLLLLLQPVLAVVWGTLFFSEVLSWMQWLGALLTLLGIYWGNKTVNEPPGKQQ